MRVSRSASSGRCHDKHRSESGRAKYRPRRPVSDVHTDIRTDGGVGGCPKTKPSEMRHPLPGTRFFPGRTVPALGRLKPHPGMRLSRQLPGAGEFCRRFEASSREDVVLFPSAELTHATREICGMDSGKRALSHANVRTSAGRRRMAYPPHGCLVLTTSRKVCDLKTETNSRFTADTAA